MYDDIITYLRDILPTSGDYATAMFFLWSSLVVVNLFGSGVRLVMSMQKKTQWSY